MLSPLPVVNYTQLKYHVTCVWETADAAVAVGDSFATVRTLRPVSDLTEETLNKVRQVPLTPPLGTSTYHLTQLLEEEKGAAERLRAMNEVLERTQQVVARYLSSWDALVAAGAGKEGFTHHPVHAYALTKHLTLGWPRLEEAMNHLHGLSQDIEWMLRRRGSSGITTEEDLASVMSGLARLHDFYTLNLTALTHASLSSHLDPSSISAGLPVTVWDLHHIGSHATAVNIWNSGVDFLLAALDHWHDNNISHHYTDLHSLTKKLTKATKMHDQVLERKGHRSKSHSTHALPLDKTLARKKKYHRQQETMLGQVGSSLQGLDQYVQLCQGNDLRPMNVTSRLYCRYVSNGSPLYVIGPLKMEVHYLRPYVVTLMGVVGVQEAQEVQKTAAVFLGESSTVQHNGRSRVGPQRTSSTAWLWEHDSPQLPRLTQRIEHLLGVNAQQHYGAEAYQVVNYGVGGHYSVHHDALSNTPYLQFHRFATFLIYLTDVPQGGRTVFPWLGVGVAPQRGSALVWFNVDHAGVWDPLLEHGACPVLLGDKWVINKWIFYGGQTLQVPCQLQPHAHVARPLL
ncbi:prolyl 4-hydroxylase subunit alpha-1-like isoform X2 [Homarus americanus]|uniref:prolyl 4-hydroxylase subunit alpha-1-like isoform X2 n=1 Tax=Homarus americanus TaxID=6706 RepID=UPI001C478AB8|nr:prolyl 4-hydroxylase subunit alpha-1-like isoform X2 [Homarus americanus]